MYLHLKKELQRQDQQEFSRIYQENYALIFNYCFRRIGDFDLARDICAETFIKVFLYLPHYRGTKDQIKAWLYRIASNEIKQYFRQRRYRPTLLRETYGNSEIYSITVQEEERRQAEETLARNEQFVEVQQALKKLPLKYQEVISLKYFEHFTIPEISLILHKKVGTVKSLLSRGLSKLRVLLNVQNQ